MSRQHRAPRNGSRSEAFLRHTLQAGIALLGLAVVASLLTACGDDDDDEAATTAPASVTATATKAGGAEGLGDLEIPAELADGMALEKGDARATLAVYEDFQCPNCLFFTTNFEPLIIEEYVKTGKVRFEFHNFPILGQESVLAAVGAVCADKQGRFWEYHNKLFQVQADANQLKDEKLNVGRYTPEKLTEYAGEVGMDASQFGACLQASEALDAVQADFNSARDAGLRGTPGFILNGQAVAYPGTPQAWRQLLDSATR